VIPQPCASKNIRLTCPWRNMRQCKATTGILEAVRHQRESCAAACCCEIRTSLLSHLGPAAACRIAVCPARSFPLAVPLSGASAVPPGRGASHTAIVTRTGAEGLCCCGGRLASSRSRPAPACSQQQVIAIEIVRQATCLSGRHQCICACTHQASRHLNGEEGV